MRLSHSASDHTTAAPGDRAATRDVEHRFHIDHLVGKGAGTDTGGHVLFDSKDPGRVYPGSLSAQSRPWQRARSASARAQRDAFADDPAGLRRRLVRKTYTASEFPMRPTQVQVEK